MQNFPSLPKSQKKKSLAYLQVNILPQFNLCMGMCTYTCMTIFNLYCPEQLNAKATDVFTCANFVSKAIMRSSGHASWCTALYGDGYLMLVWQPWKLSVLEKVLTGVH